ncbi:hypothetical protein EUGRSUZ_B00642 [Eucalyptus grandis]|uniref:Uncharacterized protein n=2 Tax=Eucalyptus grandis TaxID=71139 RepID=A0ACC3LNK0_EUCGR|nr:hypothetical protein EUGRSUZ_B00642 [Eucalyptus grandis]
MPFASPPSQKTRPRGRQHLNDANSDDPYLQLHSHGLDSFTMHNLPATRFCQNEMEMTKLSIGIECAVCSEEFEEGDWLKHLPNCAHLFHVACIDPRFSAPL